MRPRTGHERARKLYPDIGKCERGCGSKAVHRHHKDEDTFNNVRENLEFLCAVCHMKEHGLRRTRRLEFQKIARHLTAEQIIEAAIKALQ